MDKIPPDSSSLIKELEKIYPDKCPTPEQSDRDIWIAVGSRRVVQQLLDIQAQDAGELEQVLNE